MEKRGAHSKHGFFYKRASTVEAMRKTPEKGVLKWVRTASLRLFVKQSVLVCLTHIEKVLMAAVSIFEGLPADKITDAQFLARSGPLIATRILRLQAAGANYPP